MAYRRERRGRGQQRSRRCPFCADKDITIDYKNVALLSQYTSERGRIQPRRKIRVCARHQRPLARAIKRARQVALLPYTAEHVRVTG